MLKKASVSLLTIVIAVVMVIILWKYPLFLIGGILTLSFAKHALVPIHKEVAMFIVCAIIGSVGESLIMLGGPWSYANPQIVNVPIWLPFLWGLAGTTGVTIYESLINR